VLSFLSYLGGKIVLIVFMLMEKNRELASIHQVWRLETKAKQTSRWWQILDPGHCPTQFSTPASLI